MPGLNRQKIHEKITLNDIEIINRVSYLGHVLSTEESIHEPVTSTIRPALKKF